MKERERMTAETAAGCEKMRKLAFAWRREREKQNERDESKRNTDNEENREKERNKGGNPRSKGKKETE